MIIQALLSEVSDLKVWPGCGLMAEGGSKLLLWERLYVSIFDLWKRFIGVYILAPQMWFKDPQHQHPLGAGLEMQNLRPCSRPAELESALH